MALQARRYPCICSKCRNSYYFTQDGHRVQGVELSWGAREDHQLADRIANSTVAQESADSPFFPPTPPRIPTPVEEVEEGYAKLSMTNEEIPPSDIDASEDSDPIYGTSSPSSDASQRPGPFYDCSRFYHVALRAAHPLIVHTLLCVAVLTILEHNAQRVMSWLLGCIKQLLLMAAGIDVSSPLALNRPRNPMQLTIEELPEDVRTAISWLHLDPQLTYFTCCPKCFATYAPDDTPATCVAIGDRSNASEVVPSNSACGEPLFRDRSTNRPIRRCAFQGIAEWIARLLSRSEIEEALEKTFEISRRPYDPDIPIKDLHESRRWKEFRGPDGSQFTAKSNNLAFGLFTDGINPFGVKKGGKKRSITFIIMVCLNLPWEIRHLPENIFLVGIAPGPKEPTVNQMNWMLRPIVEQLQSLWQPGLTLSRTRRHPHGRHFHGALFSFCGDLLSLRKSLGFPSIGHRFMCSFCLTRSKDKSNIDPDTWVRRECETHRELAFQYRDLSTATERTNFYNTHGLRYSILSELQYWNIIDHHVVDSMHNLLLGMLHWHCRVAWAMAKVKDSVSEPGSIDEEELEDIRDDSIRMLGSSFLPASPPPDGVETRTESVPVVDTAYGSEMSSDDFDFGGEEVPLGSGWDGVWTRPPPEKIIFEEEMIRHINSCLPRIHTPTWINRPIPVLGSTSFGNLKADEWRNLFTIQLVLILIPRWSSDQNQGDLSLLENFAHLVSLVNLALKREISSQRILMYKHHLSQYLKGVLHLFEHLTLTTNHHMASHIPDGLESFGPVRSWWSFPYERLMGTILKALHNNRTGELEITFMLNFCCGSNLRALLHSSELPDGLKPFMAKLRSLYNPIQFTPPDPDAVRRLTAMKASLSNLLVRTLNSNNRHQTAHPVQWISSIEWAALGDVASEKLGSIRSQANFFKSLRYKGLQYSTFASNPNNSMTAFRPDSENLNVTCFGEIQDIFRHQRKSPLNGQLIDETFIHLHQLTEVPLSVGNPFRALNSPNLQAHLCYQSRRKSVLINQDQIIAHCAWIAFNPGEASQVLSRPTLGLVNLDRV